LHLSNDSSCDGGNRNRKALESRSLADDERITFLETQLKEAKYIAEDADRKYDEVYILSLCVFLMLKYPRLGNKA